jgi:hypothetical protein
LLEEQKKEQKSFIRSATEMDRFKKKEKGRKRRRRKKVFQVAFTSNK